MTRESVRRLAPLSDWLLWTARITAFPMAEEEVDFTSWWLELTDTLPETQVRKPAEGKFREEGPFQAGKLILSVSPGRIDFAFEPSEHSFAEEHGVPSVGPIEEILPSFVQLGETLLRLDSFPGVNRLAFAPSLLLPVEDRVTGYAQLDTFLPSVQLDSENSRDFIYRINRPRSSATAIEGLAVNRVATWSVAVFQMASFVAPIAGPARKPVLAEPRYACRLDLDVNTCGEFEHMLPSDRIVEILLELVETAKEICARGDIA